MAIHSYSMCAQTFGWYFTLYTLHEHNSFFASIKRDQSEEVQGH